MNKTLLETTADILSHYGAIIENCGEEHLEFIAPQNLSGTLNIPEYGRLCFNYGDVQENTIPASYDSDFFQSIGKLFSGKSKIITVTHPPFIPNINKITKLVTPKINFLNAAFRINGHTINPVTYALIFFKYLALSDEKQEGIFPVLINVHNLSAVVLEKEYISLIDTLKESEKTPYPPGEKTLRTLQAAHIMAKEIVKENLNDFIKSLERRLNRDIKRVREYYGTLKDEAIKLISRKLLSGEYSLENREKIKIDEMKKIINIEKYIADKSITGKGVDKLFDKLNAVSTEQNWKIKDLISKYTLKIDIEPLSAIYIETQTLQFPINIKRRMKSRDFSITYNPLLKQIDCLPCESCFYPKGAYYVCDDCLHIICAKCFKTCPRCGKRYCSACHKKICPKCKHTNTLP
ncbi:MAG: hypothetical protein ABIH08_07620 [Candidatus Omnitrophota bacterium]